MSIPKGVTTYKRLQDVPPKPEMPRNVLEAAARMTSRDDARALICGALGLSEESHLAAICLSWPERWAQMPEFARLEEIAKWLRAECFELMDLVETREKIDTRGD